MKYLPDLTMYEIFGAFREAETKKGLEKDESTRMILSYLIAVNPDGTILTLYHTYDRTQRLG